MKISNRSLLLPLFLGSGIFACSAGGDAETESVAAFHLTDSTRSGSDLFDQGFEVTTSDDCSPFGITTVEAAGCQYKVATAGQPIIRVKDLGTVGGKTVYRWPKSIPHEYAALDTQMNEYAHFVGTSLHKLPSGAGETAWLTGVRADQEKNISKAARYGARVWCGQVITQLVDNLLPEGSAFRQYGNCGEGGEVGACLAYKAGFAENEIRMCASTNDHAFAMVKHTDPAQKWCLLDRWPIVEGKNFICGIDWDPVTRRVTNQGTAVPSHWFERVNCATLPDYLRLVASLAP